MINWEQGQRLLGEYLIEKEIGQSGGMGRVWLVKSNSTGRRFAVKQTKLKDYKSRKAFLAELQTWIDLPEHPNIVPCRFFRTVGDEIVIFTDYIEGGSLADWISKQKLTTLEQILDVAIQFAWGLHAIHERGLVHQDVKPGNVLMTAGGVPMVADFGLARARQVAPDGEFVSPRQPNGQHSVLVPGSGIMTKAYASPEQRAGQPLSRKTDIWSWGVSVLDMFMGGVSCPHGGHIAADVLEAFQENGGQEERLPKMPAGVADILRMCFAREPAKRWEGIDAAAAAALGLFCDVTGQVYHKQVQKARAIPADAVQHDRQGKGGARWRNPREWLRRAYVANGRDPADADTYQMPAAYSRKGAAVADLSIFEEAERQFKDALNVWNSNIANQYAALCFEKAMVCESLNDAEGCNAAADHCIAIYRRLIDREGRWEVANDLSLALLNKATMLQRMGDLSRAVELHDQCIAIYRRLVEQEGRQELAPNMALSLTNKAAALQEAGNLAGAVELYDESIAIYRRLVEREGRRELAKNLAAAHMNKAAILMAMGDLAGAMKLYDKCIALVRHLVEQEGQHELVHDLAKAILNKAIALAIMGKLADAVTLDDESIAIYRRLVEQEGRWELANEWAATLMNKATALRELGDLAGAVEFYDECIAIYRRLVEQDGRREFAHDLAAALMNKANALKDMGDLAGAVKLYDECIASYRRLVEQEGRQELAKLLAKALINKASAHVLMDDLEGAVKLDDESIAIYRRLVEQEGRRELANNLATAVMNKASALMAMGDLTGALKLWSEYIAIYRRLVEQEGRRDLLGDLCRGQLIRAVVVVARGVLSEEERRQAREAYRTLAIEVQRTGRADLKNYMEWVREGLRGVL